MKINEIPDTPEHQTVIQIPQRARGDESQGRQRLPGLFESGDKEPVDEAERDKGERHKDKAVVGQDAEDSAGVACAAKIQNG